MHSSAKIFFVNAMEKYPMKYLDQNGEPDHNQNLNVCTIVDKTLKVHQNTTITFHVILQTHKSTLLITLGRGNN